MRFASDARDLENIAIAGVQERQIQLASALGAEDPHVTPGQHDAAWPSWPKEAATCYALPMNTPHFIVMSGLPGSGKSSIAERLAEQLKLPVLSVDPIESAIIRAGIPRSFETGLAAYLVAEALASEQLKLGNSVIIDAVNAEEEGKIETNVEDALQYIGAH